MSALLGFPKLHVHPHDCVVDALDLDTCAVSVAGGITL